MSAAAAAGTEALLEAARGGERRAVGRLLTLVEQGGPEASEIAELCHPPAGSAQVIGVSGAPGTGKSTLVGALLGVLCAQGRTPAVLAVDPSSPLSGGAILGDRIRMDPPPDSSADSSAATAAQRAFIRSLAARGNSGGLALAVPGCIRLLDACGFDPVIVETVGVGQVELDVVAVADTVVVVVNPGWGDAVQANKAGLLELADVFVVNKADRAGAADARRDLELMLDLGHVSGREDRIGRRPEILTTTATEGAGVADVWEAALAHRRHLQDSGELAVRAERRLRFEVRSLLNAAVAERVDAALGRLEIPAGASPVVLAARLAAEVLEPG